MTLVSQKIDDTDWFPINGNKSKMGFNTKVTTVFGNLQQNNNEIKEIINWTDGEIKLARKLVSNDWLRTQFNINGKAIENIWGQLELMGGDQRVDFLVFLEDLLLVIEVKDYCDFKDDKAQPWTGDNAWTQCQRYLGSISFKTANFLPVIGIVAFPKLKRRQHEEMAAAIRKYSRNQLQTDVWYSEDINKGNLKNLITKTRASISIPNIRSVDPQPLCAMQKLIPEEFIINQECSPSLSLYALEIKQTNLARNLFLTGDRIIYGVAGSGKTVILMSKALQLAEIHRDDPDWKILVLCYNKPLSKFIKKNLSLQKNIEVSTIHAWYRKVLHLWDDENHEQLKQEMISGENKSDVYFSKLQILVEEKLAVGFKLPQYNAIFVDEGQDFEETWFRHIKKAHIETDRGLFLVCLDGLQAIHRRKVGKFSWIDVEIQAQGRTTYLHKNYRNRSSIGEAIVVRLGNLRTSHKSDEFYQVLEFEEFDREGGDVIIEDHPGNKLTNTIAGNILAVPAEQSVMIIWDKLKYPEGLMWIQNRLRGAGNKREIIDCISTGKIHFPDEIKVPVYSVYRSKGLEADVVIYLHGAKRSANNDYVAYTRGREKVVDITIRRSEQRVES